MLLLDHSFETRDLRLKHLKLLHKHIDLLVFLRQDCLDIRRLPSHLISLVPDFLSGWIHIRLGAFHLAGRGQMVLNNLFE